MKPGQPLTSETLVITPDSASLRTIPKELWQAREVMLTLVGRDVRVRYAQALFGIAWAIIQPVALLVVFALVLGRDQPALYLASTLSALIGWQLFANGFGHGVNVLVDQERLLTKVYFPRLALPLSAVVVGVIDVVIVLALALPFLAWLGYPPGLHTLACLVMIPITLLVVLGPVFALSALNVRYRDVRYALPLLTQVLLFDPRWINVLAWNPLWGVTCGWRWSLLGGDLAGSDVWRSALTAAVVLIGGLWYFRRVERSFADVI
jgi:lipopolysaccharide transport system permease protein